MTLLQKTPILLLLVTGLVFPLREAKAQLATYSFEEADSLMQVAPRPVFVMMHTDWCRWCKVMKKTTLQDEEVISLLNERFYFVSFDAESKEDIRFNGQLFQNQPNSIYANTHDLAIKLGEIDDRLAYPTLTFLNPAYEITFQYSGFLNRRQFRKVLKERKE